MSVMVLVCRIAVDHNDSLVVAVGVDIDGFVVAVGDVRPNGAADGADL